MAADSNPRSIPRMIGSSSPSQRSRSGKPEPNSMPKSRCSSSNQAAPRDASYAAEDLDAIDEAEVDDVDPELGIDDYPEPLVEVGRAQLQPPQTCQIGGRVSHRRALRRALRPVFGDGRDTGPAARTAPPPPRPAVRPSRGGRRASGPDGRRRPRRDGPAPTARTGSDAAGSGRRAGPGLPARTRRQTAGRRGAPRRA